MRRKVLKLCEDKNGSAHVKDLREIQVGLQLKDRSTGIASKSKSGSSGTEVFLVGGAHIVFY